VANFVVCLKPGLFVLWSDTVHGPLSRVLTAEQTVERLCEMDQIAASAAWQVVEVAAATGTSDPSRSLEHVISTNRAGTGEERLDLDEILDSYT